MKILYSSHKAEIFPQKQLLNQAMKGKARLLFTNLWQYFASIFAPRNEPRIWQTKHHGKTVWHGYDPSTGRKVTRSSEKEMLIWIEERYYQ